MCLGGKPKVTAPAPAVIRQPYRQPNGRETFEVDDERKRRRALAAAAIFNTGGASGVTAPASIGTAKLGGG